MLDITFCEDCHTALEEYGEAAKVVYEFLCEFYVGTTGQPLSLCLEPCRMCRSVQQIFDLLERKGYVITTEGRNDEILIKPLGLWVRDYNDFVFCKNNCCRKS